MEKSPLKEVRIPKPPEHFGNQNDSLTVGAIYVAEHQFVVRDQRLFDIESSNVVMEVVADRAGSISGLEIELGSAVIPDAVALSIDESDNPSFALKLSWWVVNKYFISGLISGLCVSTLAFLLL